MIQSTDLDFIIYNIPQLTNYQLSLDLYHRMLENPQVIGVKNSSMPVQDILQFKNYTDREVVIFNGPDEQYIAGRLMGADGGISGTYAVMKEVYRMNGLDLGGVREPLHNVQDADLNKIEKIDALIKEVIEKFS